MSRRAMTAIVVLALVPLICACGSAPATATQAVRAGSISTPVRGPLATATPSQAATATARQPSATATLPPQPTASPRQASPTVTTIQRTPTETARALSPTVTTRPPTSTAMPSVMPTRPLQARTIYVANTGDDGVVVRSSTRMDARTATVLPEGTAMTIAEDVNGWARITAPVEGYIPSQFWSYSAPPATATPRVVTPGASPQPPVCSCTSNLYNCSDFKYQQDAQSCHDYCKSLGRGDIHQLDSDKDGVVCESLPRR